MDFNNLFTFSSFQEFLEILVVGLELVYVVYAFVVMRHVRLMNISFTTQAAGFFALLARIHFVAAVALVILSIVVLL